MTVDGSRPASGPAAGPAGRPPGPARHIAREPFLTRTLKPFEVLDEEGLSTHRAERRHDPPGGRPRVPRRPRRARACSATPAPTSRASASASRAGCAARSSRRPRRGSSPSTPATPSERRPDRRPVHGPRPELRLAVRPRPRQRPALRHDRGLPQLREARLHDARTSTTRGGTVCEPVDVPVNKRHLDMVYSPHPLQRQAVHGLGHRTRSGRATPSRWPGSCSARTTSRTTRSILSLINANSPLVWDATMLGAARVYAEANQATLITPFILAGAMSPVTVAGDRAPRPSPRRSAGMAFVQLVRPGAPVVLG